MGLSEKNYSDECRWICLYPAYINSKKTIAEGRRVPKEKAVDNPTCQEMMDILKAVGLNTKLEKKMYSRDQNRDLQHQGRVRIQLKNDDGVAFNTQFPTRESILVYVADSIPKLKSRQSKSGSAGSGAGGSTSGFGSGAGPQAGVAPSGGASNPGGAKSGRGGGKKKR